MGLQKRISLFGGLGLLFLCLLLYSLGSRIFPMEDSLTASSGSEQ